MMGKRHPGHAHSTRVSRFTIRGSFASALGRRGDAEGAPTSQIEGTPSGWNRTCVEGRVGVWDRHLQEAQNARSAVPNLSAPHQGGTAGNRIGDTTGSAAASQTHGSYSEDAMQPAKDMEAGKERIYEKCIQPHFPLVSWETKGRPHGGMRATPADVKSGDLRRIANLGLARVGCRRKSAGAPAGDMDAREEKRTGGVRINPGPVIRTHLLHELISLSYPVLLLHPGLVDLCNRWGYPFDSGSGLEVRISLVFFLLHRDRIHMLVLIPTPDSHYLTGAEAQTTTTPSFIFAAPPVRWHLDPMVCAYAATVHRVLHDLVQGTRSTRDQVVIRSPLLPATFADPRFTAHSEHVPAEFLVHAPSCPMLLGAHITDTPSLTQKFSLRNDRQSYSELYMLSSPGARGVYGRNPNVSRCTECVHLSFSGALIQAPIRMYRDLIAWAMPLHMISPELASPVEHLFDSGSGPEMYSQKVWGKAIRAVLTARFRSSKIQSPSGSEKSLDIARWRRNQLWKSSPMRKISMGEDPLRERRAEDATGAKVWHSEHDALVRRVQRAKMEAKMGENTPARDVTSSGICVGIFQDKRTG
ncbi:hypothetical protein DFH09DRAFT_1089181 [Mycena vulgaris]|nr:hypothetical protein DFH09DRAFT_1089181 [Mycena vulgaris]